MKNKELKEKFRKFVDDLQEHRKLYAESLDKTIPRYPIRNQKKLGVQQKELTRQLYILDPYVNIFTKGRVMRHPATGIEWDIYRSAVGNDIAQIKGKSLDNAILELEGIISILETKPIDEEIEPVNPISPLEIKKSELKTIQIFDSLNLHPIIVDASRSLFVSGHYSQAIFEAFKAINNYVKEKSRRQDLDGQDLMAQVFNEKKPIIKLNPLSTQSDRDEQAGFRFIYMGLMTGIRNPKAHDQVEQKDSIRTLKYLALASLLIERAEKGRVNEKE